MAVFVGQYAIDWSVAVPRRNDRYVHHLAVHDVPHRSGPKVREVRSDVQVNSNQLTVILEGFTTNYVYMIQRSSFC